VKLLKELGAKNSFEVVIIPPVEYHGEVVSSTIIRREVAEGDVSHAGRLLGRPFALTGQVVPGTGTGRKFTFPTLNLAAEQELLPARGVYITRTVLKGETCSHRSVTNIGVRPTFNGSSLSVETHLLDFQPETTPKRIEVRFWERLREEKKFSGPEELRAQIAADIARAGKFFSRLRRFRTARNRRRVFARRSGHQRIGAHGGEGFALRFLATHHSPLAFRKQSQSGSVYTLRCSCVYTLGCV
jgi:riboflavin kinase/FMN adenylyltransferase